MTSFLVILQLTVYHKEIGIISKINTMVRKYTSELIDSIMKEITPLEFASTKTYMLLGIKIQELAVKKYGGDIGGERGSLVAEVTLQSELEGLNCYVSIGEIVEGNGSELELQSLIAICSVFNISIQELFNFS